MEEYRSKRGPKRRAAPVKNNAYKTMREKVVESIQQQITDATAMGQFSVEGAIMSLCERACDMRDELFEKIDELGDRLPPNTLDQLIEELGGPKEVAVGVSKISHLK